MSTKKRNKQPEGQIVHKDGKITDAGFHAGMIDDEAANREIQRMAVAQAIAGGMDKKTAQLLYGYRKGQ